MDRLPVTSEIDRNMNELIKSKKLIATRKRFLGARTPDDLQAVIGIPAHELLDHMQNPLYSSFKIKKSSGETRIIEAPSPRLKIVQKKICRLLNSVYPAIANDHVMGFVPAMPNKQYCAGIIANAKAHVRQPFVVNMDIKDFFPSITTAMVRNTFLKPPFSFRKDVATMLALLTCYNKHLPQGAPTSPVISNFVFAEADLLLAALATKMNLRYTRYADDLTFSGDVYPTDNLPAMVEAMILSFNFTLNPKKIRHQSAWSRQEVTGIKVNEKLNVDRRYIRHIRAMLQDWDCNGLEQAAAKFNGRKLRDVQEFIRIVKGKIDFVGQVRGKEDRIYRKFCERVGMLVAYSGM